MRDLKVVECGVNSKHDKGFAFTQRKTKGDDCYLFVFFKTGFFSQTQEGIKKGEANSYILFKPHSGSFHTGVPESATGFINDWAYLKGDFIDELVCEMNIPTDVIVPLYKNNKISKLIGELSSELVYPLPAWERRVESIVVELFVELVRNDYNVDGYTNNSEFNVISNVKKAVFKDYKSNWTLQLMADYCGFSVPHFISRYKKYYKESPINDLINYRINKARFSLEVSNDSISKISEECGFSTPYYFSRVFKKRVGISPKEYRRKYFSE